MLGEVLDKKTCAECRFCCAFEKADSWEIPVISEQLAESLQAQGIKTVMQDGCIKFDLEFVGNEIKNCPFLDTEKGCVLSEDEKPFDCKIWPLRVMKQGNKRVLALAKTCPNFRVTKTDLLRLINKGLLKTIREYISKNNYVINELKEDYEVLMEF